MAEISVDGRIRGEVEELPAEPGGEGDKVGDDWFFNEFNENVVKVRLGFACEFADDVGVEPHEDSADNDTAGDEREEDKIV